LDPEAEALRFPKDASAIEPEEADQDGVPAPDWGEFVC
jgi:hypothetical protein